MNKKLIGLISITGIIFLVVVSTLLVILFSRLTNTNTEVSIETLTDDENDDSKNDETTISPTPTLGIYSNQIVIDLLEAINTKDWAEFEKLTFPWRDQIITENTFGTLPALSIIGETEDENTINIKLEDSDRNYLLTIKEPDNELAQDKIEIVKFVPENNMIDFETLHLNYLEGMYDSSILQINYQTGFYCAPEYYIELDTVSGDYYIELKSVGFGGEGDSCPNRAFVGAAQKNIGDEMQFKLVGGEWTTGSILFSTDESWAQIGNPVFSTDEIIADINDLLNDVSLGSFSTSVYQVEYSWYTQYRKDSLVFDYIDGGNHVVMIQRDLEPSAECFTETGCHKVLDTEGLQHFVINTKEKQVIQYTSGFENFSKIEVNELTDETYLR